MKVPEDGSAAAAEEAADARLGEAPARDAVAETTEPDAGGDPALAGAVTVASEARPLAGAVPPSEAGDGDPVAGVETSTLPATPLQANRSPAEGEPADTGLGAALPDPSASAIRGAVDDPGEETSGGPPARSSHPSVAGLGESARDDSESGGLGGAAGEESATDGGANGEQGNPSWIQDMDATLAPAPNASAPDASAPAVTKPDPAGEFDPSLAPAIDPSVNHSAPTGNPVARAAGTPQDSIPPEARFAAANHEDIVKGMRAEVLPNGGTMRIRLDPPQLGALQVTVEIRDGVVTAAFETSNDEATRLLGHSLNQLKAVLESHGMGVDKLQVQQAPRDERPATTRDDPNHPREQSPQDQEQAARQEQQRKEMLRRMWRQLAGGEPLDVMV